MQILQEKKLQESMTLTFYVNGMITKLKLTTYPGTVPTVAFNADYGAEYRLKANCVVVLSNLIGGVTENIDGLMLGSGILGDYYADPL